MTDNMIELGKRAVACRGWKWMPGMRTLDAMRVIHDPDRWPDRPCAIREGSWVDTAPPRPLGDDLPDLSDPATLGCLLALVREAYRDASKLWDGHVEVRRDHRILFFVVSFRHDASGALVEDTLTTGGTEAEALVASLESVP
jgi:hypothetical protein